MRSNTVTWSSHHTENIGKNYLWHFIDKDTGTAYSFLPDIFFVFTTKQQQKCKVQASNISYALLNNFHGKLHLGMYEFFIPAAPGMILSG